MNLTLLILLMMFPQFVETIYSPGLPHIAKAFQISQEKTLLTISLYFTAFAFGVVFWGILSDRIGRRNTMLLGLFIYIVGSGMALAAPNFEIILVARLISAFGIAVGSVITQTILRDQYTKIELNKVFSTMGIALSISPVIGLFCGSILVLFFGYKGLFSLLFILGLFLFWRSWVRLVETKKTDETPIGIPQIFALAKTMITDKAIWRSAILVMCFNVLLFNYYAFAPFIFDKNGVSLNLYGYSGIILAIGSFLGSSINKRLISLNFTAHKIIQIASILAVFSSLLLFFTQEELTFLIPIIGVVTAFGMAIPAILSQALMDYENHRGSAGALFGLLYYLLIGLGLSLSSCVGSLAIVYTAFSIIAFVISYCKIQKAVAQ